MLDKALLKALENWRNWGLAEKPQLIETFTTGQNHHTGLIQSGAKYYVLKVFNHSFEHAIAAELIASDLGLAPKLMHTSNNIALFDFIETQASNQLDLTGVARALSKLHSHDAGDLGNFDLLVFCKEYLSSADELSLSWHQLLLPALNYFVNDTTPWCFCHNDLVSENCLFSDKVFFIDWEFAQQHNPWFDLAAIIVYFELSDDQARTLLDEYGQNWGVKTRTSIFYTSQISLLWADLLWHMHKYGTKYRNQNATRFTQLKELAMKVGIQLTT